MSSVFTEKARVEKEPTKKSLARTLPLKILTIFSPICAFKIAT